MKLPKLGRVVEIEFWSLRGVDDRDVIVTRKCRRIRCYDGWKWQVVGFYEEREWDVYVGVDQECINEPPMELPKI